MTRYASGFIAFVFALGAQQVSAACVEFALLDDAGEAVQSDVSAIGMMVGDEPIFPMRLPPYASRRQTASVKCPEYVIAPIQDLYDLSCYSDQAMEKVAENNKQDVGHIRQRCADLKSALSSATIEQ